MAKTLCPTCGGDYSMPRPMPIDRLLLAKFPAFNPDWPVDVMVKWFDDFDRLIRLHKGD